MSLSILIAHNSYQQFGGEDAVVDAERMMLEANGDRVQLLRRSNLEVERMSAGSVASAAIWSRRSSKELDGMLRTSKPDVLHVHNTFPLLSPSIYWMAAKHRVPVIQTLHNFRLFCAQAMFLRDGAVCEDCLGGFPWRGVLHACYRDSSVQTGVLLSMLGVHRIIGTYTKKIDRFIALNEFCRQKFISGGIPEVRLSIKPNFIEPPAVSWLGNEGEFLFVGRLSIEKGTRTLAKAVESLESFNFKVCGDGPDFKLLAKKPNVQMLGRQEPNQVLEAMSKAECLVIPSIWYENFPRTLVEAFAVGLPVVASRIGALAELIEDGKTGLLFSPNDPADLARKLVWVRANPEQMRRMAHNARREYLARYTPRANYEMLREIYREVLEQRRGA